MNDNRYKTKLHVSSETRKGSGDDTNEFRFDLPNGVSHLKKVTIAEAEIVNSMTPIHPGNNKVYFNEFTCLVEHEGSDSHMVVPSTHLPKLTFITTMYEGRIPHENYTVDSMLAATETAMNTAVPVFTNTGTTLDELKIQNKYHVIRSPDSNAIRVAVLATDPARSLLGSYKDQNQFSRGDPVSDFAIRTKNLHSGTLNAINATWNPFGNDPFKNNLGGSSQSYTRDNIDNPLHCSPCRVVMRLPSSHSFIPGDPIQLAFDELTFSSSEIRIDNTAASAEAQPSGVYSVLVDPSSISTLGGFVAYVNGDEVHVLVKAIAGKSFALTNCTIRLTETSTLNSVASSQASGCVELGTGNENRQGLLVSSLVKDTSSVTQYSTRVYANAATDYLAFKTGASTNPFANGGTIDTIGLAHKQFVLHTTNAPDVTTGTIELGTSSFNSTLTLTNSDDNEFLSNGDAVKLNFTSAGTFTIGGATPTSGTIYFIRDKTGTTVKLAQSPGGAALALLNSVPTDAVLEVLGPYALHKDAGSSQTHSAVQLSSFHFLQNDSKVCFTNLLANDHDTIKEQTKIVRVDQREDTHLVTHSTTVPRIGIGVGSSAGTNEGDGTITAANITNGIGKVIWTRKDTATTANVFNIGYPHVIGTENVDLTRNGRVVFIELEAVGIGPIGDLHLAGSDRTYFGRCQLDAGYLALTLNNDSMVGEYEFDNFVKPREMVIRLYDEKGEPLKTMGTHNSFLLELEGVGTYSGCR